MVIAGAGARIEGSARVEKAEALLAFLDATPGAPVDPGPANHLRTAVLQVLLAYRPPADRPSGGCRPA